jgi:molybdate transport system substrate-binding protein
VRNELQIATPKDNPGGITGLSDFGKSALRIVVCAQVVPCGAAADKVFQAAGLTAEIDSYEQDVKGVLTKVTSGEADAGLVYRTDVKAAGDSVVGISFPESANAINDYPIVALTESRNASAAAAWVAYMAGAEAKAAFQEAGFQVP